MPELHRKSQPFDQNSLLEKIRELRQHLMISNKDYAELDAQVTVLIHEIMNTDQSLDKSFTPLANLINLLLTMGDSLAAAAYVNGYRDGRAEG